MERLETLRTLYGGPLADPGGAYRASLALFELDPADAKNREALIGFAQGAGTTAELCAVLRAVSASTDDQILRRDLLVIVAELEEQRLGRAPEAEKVYAQILAAEPLHAGAFRALARLQRDGQRWADLRALLDARQLAALDVRERLDLLAEVAELDESALNDADHALGAYEKMLELDPTDLRAHRALDRHYAARERWRDLETLLGTRVELASETEVPELEFRRAELRASHLGDVDGALDLLEGIVRTAPAPRGGAPPARAPREPRRAPAAGGQDPGADLRGERRLGAPGRHPGGSAGGARGAGGGGVARPLRRAAGDPAAGQGRRARHLAAGAGRRSRQPRGAPADRAARHGVLERFSELVDVYQELAFKRDATDVSGRADLLSRAARLYAGKLGNRRAAIDVWKLVLNVDPNNVETAGPAAAALETLYTETGDVASLVKILGQQAQWAPGAAERKKLLFRIAGLEEKSLGDIDAAVTTLRAILEIDPQEREAIDALDRIFEAGSQHRQRVEILRKRIDLAGDAGARQELWRRVASLLERDVGDVDEAIAACVSILDESPEDDQALETLARLYEQQGRHRDRLEILERRLALGAERRPAGTAASALAHRLGLLRQIAALLEGPLGDPADALGRWREVLERAPADPEALAALERFLAPGTDGGLRLAAAQALEPVYESTGRFAELAAVVRVYVDAQGDARARLEQLMRLAAIEETPARRHRGRARHHRARHPRRARGA